MDKTPLQEAFEIAAKIVEAQNSALLERIGQLEQSLGQMEQSVEKMQQRILELENLMASAEAATESTEEEVMVEVVAAEEEKEIEAVAAGEEEEVMAEEIDMVAAGEEEEVMAEEIDMVAAGEEEEVEETVVAEEIVEEIAEEIAEEVAVGKEIEFFEEPVVIEKESIPDTMAGIGILPFAEELAEKANESAPGSDVFELMDAQPDWFDWEVDYPASYVDDVYKAISFNDRFEFIKELFNLSGDLTEAEVLFKETLDDINEMESFKQVVGYIRRRFPQWDEQSDEVYRFYMSVRRKFNKQ